MTKNCKSKLFVGLEGDPGDSFSNETIINALRDARLSTDYVNKIYKGKGICVWEVTPEFLKNLYIFKARNNALRFEAYVEERFAFRKFRLFEPDVKKRAKFSKFAKR